jgi:hypothetical protein
MNKLKKIFSVVAILVAAGFLLWGTNWLFQYYQYRTSPEYKAQKYLDEMEKKYREDTYGGTTPEETLQLFIAALKKGDTDLASKYFVIDKQEEWLENLEKIKEKEKLQNMIFDLSRNKEKQILSDNHTVFYIYNDDNLLAVAIDVVKIPNGKWKIQSM